MGSGTVVAQPHQIEVRDYIWKSSALGQSLRVQSPHLSVQEAQPPYVVRQVDAKGRHKYEKAQHADALEDSVGKKSYKVHAHGALIPDPKHEQVDLLWICQQQFNIQEPLPIKFVNLSDFTTSESPYTLICWVPSLRRADGGLITLLLAGKPFGVAICQKLHSPQATALVQVTTKELAGYERIEEPEQRSLYDQQLAALRVSMQMPDPIPSPASPSRELTTPETILKNVRLLKKSVLGLQATSRPRRTSEEDLEVPGFKSSDWSTDIDCHSSSEYSSDDDSELDGYEVDDKPFFSTTRPCSTPSSRQAYCCKYSDLAPSLKHPSPSHRHNQNHECAFGAWHDNHCVFADFSPDECVVPSSGKPHEHCRPVRAAPCATSAVSDAPGIGPLEHVSPEAQDDMSIVTDHFEPPTEVELPLFKHLYPSTPANSTDYESMDHGESLTSSATIESMATASTLDMLETLDTLDTLDTPRFEEIPISPMDYLDDSQMMPMDDINYTESEYFDDFDDEADKTRPDCWIAPVNLDQWPSTPRPQDLVF